MSRFRLFDLNEAQHKAVTTTEGPLLILAGAGTGKTRVITARVAFLIAQGINPANILAVTFTNKAANEMRERLAALVEKEQAKKVTMSTFHALCVRILRGNIDKLGYKNNFSIYDESDQLGLIRKIITRTAAKDEKLDPNIAKNAISRAKNNGWSGAEVSNILEFEHHFPNPAIVKLEQNYRSTNAILGTANSLIKNNPRRRPKKLWSAREGGEKIRLVQVPHDREEAQFVVEEI